MNLEEAIVAQLRTGSKTLPQLHAALPSVHEDSIHRALVDLRRRAFVWETPKPQDGAPVLWGLTLLGQNASPPSPKAPPVRVVIEVRVAGEIDPKHIEALVSALGGEARARVVPPDPARAVRLAVAPTFTEDAAKRIADLVRREIREREPLLVDRKPPPGAPAQVVPPQTPTAPTPAGAAIEYECTHCHLHKPADAFGRARGGGRYPICRVCCGTIRSAGLARARERKREKQATDAPTA